MSELLKGEDAIKRLLEVDPNDLPEREVSIDRLGIAIKLRALTGKTIDRIRQASTFTYQGKRGQTVEKLNSEEFSAGLIEAAIISPALDAPELLAAHGLSSSREVIKRLFLAGEIDAIGDAVMSLSGFDTELEDVKK